MTIQATVEMSTAPAPARVLCLLIEPAAHSARRLSGTMRRLDVGEGISWLGFDGDGLPALSRSASDEAIAIEPVQHGWKLYLALADPFDRSLQVNGAAAGPVAVLKTGDQLALGEYLLHVTILERPYVGPAGAEDLNRECPVCSLKIEDGAVIFCCATCGTAMHWGDGSPNSLECARLAGKCAGCDGPISTSEGLVYEPAG